MIAKISATENLGRTLGYNFKKVEKGEANILLAAELYQSKEGRYTMEDVLADMQALILEKYRTKKTVFHCSLNPHPDEKLSDETLMQIAKEYMEALGYGNQSYIVFKQILPVSIYTSYHFGWTIVDGRLTISSRNGRARRLPMPWKENLVSFQVQRLLTKRWKKCPRLIPPKEISRSKCQMLSEWYWNIIIFAPWVSWTPSFLHTTLP